MIETVDIFVSAQERVLCLAIADAMASRLPSFKRVADALRLIADGHTLRPGNAYNGDYQLFHLAGWVEDCFRNRGRGGSTVIPRDAELIAMSAATILRWSAEVQDAASARRRGELRDAPPFPKCCATLHPADVVLFPLSSEGQ